jgi:hypothetical protein
VVGWRPQAVCSAVATTKALRNQLECAVGCGDLRLRVELVSFAHKAVAVQLCL